MKTILLLGSVLLASRQVPAQQAQVAAVRDSSLLAGAVRTASQRYLADAPELRLLNGVAYATTVPSYVRGRPFYQTSDPQPGTLDYDGRRFVGVPLLYDQVQDQVLLYGAAQAGPMQLIRQKVQAFELAGHQFVRLPADSAGVLTEGFYDLVVAGPAQLWARRTKKLNAATTGYDLKGDYEEKTRFFVQRRGHFFELATLKQALGALADHGGEIQVYARNNRLRFAPDSREASLAALIRHYNTLAVP